MTAYAAGYKLERGTGAWEWLGNTTATPRAENGLYGPKSPPADLLGFVRDWSVSEASLMLGLGRGTVARLRHGYWPTDPRKIERAWSRYKAQRGVMASWFLRRVYPGGIVRHAGRAWGGMPLAGRTGQLLAVAREAGGGLVAQTLELPAERLPLLLVQSGGAA
ncbi:hypothetical protein [Paracidovorax anthurii]|uniref:Uncharacterized protein n=1 Tax=Paracidovorax anthurii TaxID=78229 RepID=A0A328ZIL8_9BURK|nr:hypothetical protein [Paracidovorax anthurii]RAR86068.1 hypothetical protein AX018_100229 [Paracidovorax anthurii]